MTSVRVEAWPTKWPTIKSGNIPCLNGHDVRWQNSVCLGLKHRGFLIKAESSNHSDGILPLVLVKGPIFGKFLVSLPYINTGGVWAKDQAVAETLVDAACELADEHDVKYLELRHEEPIEHAKLNFARTDKVHMRLALPATDEELDKSFKSKVRSQIKKSGSYGSTVHFGGRELLPEYYDVFAQNMRDLGTPVFSKQLFEAILDEFKDSAELCVVRQDSKAIAAGLLVHNRGVSEVPSASSLREFNRLGANMWMYRHLLRRSIERGSHTFDFGRSSEDSGTYKFKAQWGAVPSQATWQYYVRKGDPNEMRPDAGGKKRLVELWTKLPVWFTRMIGPTIVRGIP